MFVMRGPGDCPRCNRNLPPVIHNCYRKGQPVSDKEWAEIKEVLYAEEEEEDQAS